MGFISVKQYTPKLQLLSMFFGSKNQTKKEVLQFKRKGLGNKEFSNWNPQSEFTSDEGNREFQGIYADGTSCLYFCLLVKGPHEMSLSRNKGCR